MVCHPPKNCFQRIRHNFFDLFKARYWLHVWHMPCPAQANYRFLVSDGVDAAEYHQEADRMFEWQDVLQVGIADIVWSSDAIVSSDRHNG